MTGADLSGERRPRPTANVRGSSRPPVGAREVPGGHGRVDAALAAAPGPRRLARHMGAPRHRTGPVSTGSRTLASEDLLATAGQGRRHPGDARWEVARRARAYTPCREQARRSVVPLQDAGLAVVLRAGGPRADRAVELPVLSPLEAAPAWPAQPGVLSGVAHAAHRVLLGDVLVAPARPTRCTCPGPGWVVATPSCRPPRRKISSPETPRRIDPEASAITRTVSVGRGKWPPWFSPTRHPGGCRHADGRVARRS